MSDNSDKAVPKLVDFGLAKIMGPSEKAAEPFGTLGYVAPEVLKKEPYSYSCDMWSIGCVGYALMSGTLPFDGDTEKETIRMTLKDKLVFDVEYWEDKSNDVKDLLSKLLIKDQSQRMNLKEFFSHKWVTSMY